MKVQSTCGLQNVVHTERCIVTLQSKTVNLNNVLFSAVNNPFQNVFLL